MAADSSDVAVDVPIAPKRDGAAPAGGGTLTSFHPAQHGSSPHSVSLDYAAQAHTVKAPPRQASPGSGAIQVSSDGNAMEAWRARVAYSSLLSG